MPRGTCCREQLPQFSLKNTDPKNPIHGLYAGVARDSCLPCKRYCCAASRAAACRAPVALLVASRVNVPLLPDWGKTIFDIGTFEHEEGRSGVRVIKVNWSVESIFVIMMTSSKGNIFRVTGQWRGALMFSLICARINDWVNNREAGDLRRYRCHYDVNVMIAKLAI